MENKKIVTVQMTEEFYNKVMVDVPQEGGGSGTPLSKDMIYLDLSDWNVDDKTMIANYALFAKYKDESGNAYFVNPWAFAGTSISVWSDMDYFAVFSSLIVQGSDGNNASVIDELSVVFPNFSATPRITEEEFYNLDNEGDSMIEFTIDGTTYQAEEGMTWQDFVDSSYNNGEFSLNVNYVVHNGQYLQYPVEGNMYATSRPTDVIVAGTNYSYMAL